ncbi:hypothetical protein LAUMK7_00401 [Mycobacterium kansasii]|uniref:Uncharacterized protein n=1 Tax=Mycobacterium kansasii TaxID=1768 RepID=A0A653F6M9_MYCKA|nr:hypothetical protein MKANGN_50050 [Mycobacterium kansasii]VAZ63617.1 hypothetical protein LAUMK22_05458 [Mycobacterium kansasii]VAZ64379.1 hypothetical protein LAUMK40_00496 [Mycobacterium kansasii]VAZ70576.1 hypothetical protein LAUMK7_00401 [Mycobacterium kansasii]VTP05263.1 hypothetical protein BIN_B_05105 [Mycobacterium kansasii]
MTERVIDSGEWTEEVDAYIAGMNAIAGKSGPSPLFDENFSMKSTGWLEDSMSLMSSSVMASNVSRIPRVCFRLN